MILLDLTFPWFQILRFVERLRRYIAPDGPPWAFSSAALVRKIEKRSNFSESLLAAALAGAACVAAFFADAFFAGAFFTAFFVAAFLAGAFFLAAFFAGAIFSPL